jgi:hypothetical protein
MALVWKLLTLIAVLAMPLGMTAAPAATMQHHAASMPMQHCPDQAPGHDSKGAFVACTMACSAALPAIDRSSEQPAVTTIEPAPPAAMRQLHGLHPETATPPPKLS